MYPLSSAKTSREGKLPNSFQGGLRSIQIHSRIRNSIRPERWLGPLKPVYKGFRRRSKLEFVRRGKSVSSSSRRDAGSILRHG